MEPIYLITDFLIIVILAGLVSTVSMIIFMQLVSKFTNTEANMVKAIGSFFTQSLESSTLVGGFIHLIVGIVFACIYTLLFQYLHVSGYSLIALGALIGFIHGFCMSLILVAIVAEHHPLRRYRKAGIGVAVTHFAGHIVYGAVIGLVLFASNYQTPTADEYVSALENDNSSLTTFAANDVRLISLN